jgi:uncharacterized protein
MKKAITALLLTASVAFSAPAALPSQQSVEKLATLTMIEKLHDAVIDNMQQTFDGYVKQVLRGEPPTAADKAVVDAFRPKMLKLIEDGLSGPDIKTMYEQVYVASYTQEEVDNLILFYSTPLGQEIAKAQLQIPFKISTMMQQSLSKMGPQLQVEIYSAVRKIAQAHAPKPAPKPAPAPAAKPAAPAAIPAATPAAKAN